jgi:rhamnogalacturonyl hydrolase YesR
VRLLSTMAVPILLLSGWAAAQAGGPTRDEVLQAMRDGADYASSVLIDKDGKSRCDYSMLEGAWHDYEPAWHTGQIIFGLVETYKILGDEKYLDAARRAGDWWTGLEIKDTSRLNGMVRAIHGDGINYIVCATVTDGTPGLFDLYRLTKVKRYADVPTSAGKWMLRNFYLPKEGMLYDVADPVTGEVLKEDSPFWKDKKHQTLNDVARPNNEGFLYKDMYEYTGDTTYRDVFVNLCESLVAKQGPEGLWMQFMPNNAQKGSFHPRFNLWYAESLIEGYTLTRDRRYLDAAKKTLALYARFQKPNGTIFYTNYLNGRSNENSITGSATAFAGILWIRLQQLGVGHEFRDNIERSARWLVENRYASSHPDVNLAGATINSRTRLKGERLYITQRDLGTSFALRFLALFYTYAFGPR